MTTPFGTELSPARKKMLAFLVKPRQCVRCRRAYREVDNLGLWACPLYHPLASAPRTSSGAYACCNRFDAGCVRADHTDGDGDKLMTKDSGHYVDVTADDTLFMASVLKVPVLEVKRETWRFDNKASLYRVPRLHIADLRRALVRQFDE